MDRGAGRRLGRSRDRSRSGGRGRDERFRRGGDRRCDGEVGTALGRGGGTGDRDRRGDDRKREGDVAGRSRGADDRDRRGEDRRGDRRGCEGRRHNERRDVATGGRGALPSRSIPVRELRSRLFALIDGTASLKHFPKYSKELKEIERRFESKVKAAAQHAKDGSPAEPWDETLGVAVEVLEGGGRVPQETLVAMLEAVAGFGSSNGNLQLVLLVCVAAGLRLDVRTFAKILGVYMYRGAPAEQVRVILNLMLPKGQDCIPPRAPRESAETVNTAISEGRIASSVGASTGILGIDHEPALADGSAQEQMSAADDIDSFDPALLQGCVWSYDPRSLAYFAHFCALLHLEHLHEVKAVQTLRVSTPVGALVQSGLAVAGLSVLAIFGRREPGSGRTILPGWDDTGSEMVAFGLRGDRAHCEASRLRIFRGDAVTVSRGDPRSASVGEADVVEVRPGDRIIVQLKGSMPQDAKEDRCAWRIDKGVNTAAYERQMAALVQVSGSNQPGKRPPLAELLISARVGDIDQWAAQMQQGKQARSGGGACASVPARGGQPTRQLGYHSKEARAERGELNEDAGEGWKANAKSTIELAEAPPQARTIWDRVGARDGRTPDEEDVQDAKRMLQEVRELNESQRAAVEAALSRTCTLIQGPPGTGKTHVSVQILRLWAHALKLSPLLASSDSNVAVDNIAEGLQKAGVHVVRTGRGEKVRHSVEQITLDSIFMRERDAKLQEEGRGIPADGDFEDSVQASSIEFAPMHDEAGRSSRKGGGRGKSNDQEGHEQEWKKRSQDFEMQMKILHSAEVICSTTIAAGGDFLQKFHFAGALIDEVAQATELSAIVPVILRGAKRVVFVGDDCQLPPGVRAQEAQLRGLSMSVYSRLKNAGLEPFFLDRQYRSHPALAEFSAQVIYKGALQSGIEPSARQMPKGFAWPSADVPVALLDSDPFEEQKEGDSRANQNEAAWILQIVQQVLQCPTPGGLAPDEIGIVTPYSAQVQLMRRLLSREGPALEIASIDAFQGREKELVIFSAVRANAGGRVGFLADWRRLNVMLTRARCGLIVVGSVSTLRHDEFWRLWLEWCLRRGAADATTLATLQTKLARLAANAPPVTNQVVPPAARPPPIPEAALGQEVASPTLTKHVLAALTKNAEEVKNIPGATTLAAQICPDIVGGRPVLVAKINELVRLLNRPPSWWMSSQ